MAETTLRRLARQGWQGSAVGNPVPAGWAALDSVEAAEQLPGERLWLSALPHPPLLAPGDCYVDAASPPSETPAAEGYVTLALQDSPFAVEHGFLLAAGGPAHAMEIAAPLFDALAPMPSGWLHAGGIAAPHFLAAIARELGGGLGAMAALMGNLHLSGMHPLWQGQQALVQRLGMLAADYLQADGDRGYRPVRPLPPLFAFAGESDVAPASQVAKLLVWMAGQAQAERH